MLLLKHVFSPTINYLPSINRYITLSDGRLAVLSASDGSLRWEYTPPPASPGWTVKCNSNVYFGELSRIGKFAVYAIIDEAPAGLLEDNRS